MDLMEKVRQVGEHYELNKYKTLNKTIELDARLANERLLATKLRLSQVSSMNDKLMRQLRSLQQDFRQQENKLLLTETMLRQLAAAASDPKKSRAAIQLTATTSQAQLGASEKPPAPPLSSGGRTGRAGRLSKFGRSQTTAAASSRAAPSASASSAAAAMFENANKVPATAAPRPPVRAINDSMPRIMLAAASGGAEQQAAGASIQPPPPSTNSSATQTQVAPSRTKSIINDLRQRLNLVGSNSNSAKG